jgi:hypothetical protein
MGYGATSLSIWPFRPSRMSPECSLEMLVSQSLTWLHAPEEQGCTILYCEFPKTLRMWF